MGANIRKQAKKIYVANIKHKIVNFETQKVEPNLQKHTKKLHECMQDGMDMFHKA